MVNYATAKSRCAAWSGYIAMPKSLPENDLLKGMMRGALRRACWLGLDDRKCEGAFIWGDGETLTGWNNWGDGEPNDYDKNEDCAHIRTNGEWNDDQCTKGFHYICQVPIEEMKTECSVDPPPENGGSSTSAEKIPIGDSVEYFCDDGYVASGDTLRTCQKNGNLSGEAVTCVKIKQCPTPWISGPSSQCYRGYDALLNYADATEACKTLGGSLVMPKSPEEQSVAITARVNGRESSWLGLDDIEIEGSWRWADGDALTWNNWNSREPNNAGGREDCGHMRADTLGLWNDAPCNVLLRYICQVDYDVLTRSTTTSRPTTTTTDVCETRPARARGGRKKIRALGQEKYLSQEKPLSLDERKNLEW